MISHEEEVSREYIYRGKILNLRRDVARFSDGRDCVREVIEHKGAVAVAALDGEDNLYLVRQYRYPFKAEFLEIPAGKLDSDEEAPENAAARELREETGFRAERLEFLGTIYPSVAMLTEKIHIFLARDLTPGAAEPDEDEFIDTVALPLAEFEKMAQRGEIHDAKTLCALYLLRGKLESEKNG